MSGPEPYEFIADLWPVGRVDGVTKLHAGAVNRIFEIAAAAGVFYLRAYRTKDAAIIAREHALIRQVRDRGLPAIAPLATPAGTTVVDLGGTWYALFPKAEGHQILRPELSPDHAEAAGDMLGRLHAAMRPLGDAGYRRYEIAWHASDWIERLHAIERAILARGGLTDSDRHALNRTRAQRAWLADPACSHAHASAYPPQAIHGDYHHGNLFFSAAGVSGIIDWEQAAFMPPAFEAARAVTYMFELAPEPTTRFLHAYRQRTAMSIDELEDGGAAWGCMRDHWVWALEEVFLHGNERARGFFPVSSFEPFHRSWAKVSAGLGR